MTVADLTTADACIAALLLASAIVGLVRGLVREVLSLGGWIVAFIAGGVFGPVLARELLGVLEPAALREPAGFLLAFATALIMATLMGRLLRSVVHAAGLGGLDRLFGAAFGAARGVIVVLVAVVALQPFAHTAAWWQESALIGLALGFENDARALLDAALTWLQES